MKYLLTVIISVGLGVYIFQQQMVSKNSYTNIYNKEIINKFPKISELENGDIIFRRAYGVDSNVAVNFSDGEKRYSHAGIVVKDINNTYVIHSLDDRELDYNGVVKELIQEYLEDIDIWAIYRYDINITSRKKISEYALKLKNRNIQFDKKFDLMTDDKMYCSEFIFKVVNLSTNVKIINAKKRFLGRTFVTISNLYENEYSKIIESSHLLIR